MFNFTGGKWAVWKTIERLGFMWRKLESNRKVLTEKDDIHSARLAYSRNISHYLSKGCPIIYMDNTYVMGNSVE
jgi:hypothetical protein